MAKSSSQLKEILDHEAGRVDVRFSQFAKVEGRQVFAYNCVPSE